MEKVKNGGRIEREGGRSLSGINVVVCVTFVAYTVKVKNSN